MKRLISIIVPAYNEEEVVSELAKRMTKVIGKIDNYDFEIIIIDHGSTDSTFDKLLSIYNQDKRFKIIQSSRNFKGDAAISAGMKYAKGDAIVIMAADLQDPPEIIPQFIEKWELGYDVVYGVITKREGVPFYTKCYAFLFYIVINKLTRGLFPRNVTDFRLINKKVCETVNVFKERNRFLRGIIAWTGFKQTGVPFVREPRFAGQAKGNFWGNLELALNALFSFSYFPLRIVTALGLIVSFFSFGVIIIYVYRFFRYGRVVHGYASTMTTILFLFGVLFFILGIIGEYLARIYDEVKGRPDFIITKKIGFE